MEINFFFFLGLRLISFKYLTLDICGYDVSFMYYPDSELPPYSFMVIEKPES